MGYSEEEPGWGEEGPLGLRRAVSGRKPGSGALRPGPLCMAQLVLRWALAWYVVLSLHGHLGPEAARMWPQVGGDGWG